MTLAEAKTAIPTLRRSTSGGTARFRVGGPMNGITGAIDVAPGFDQMVIAARRSGLLGI